MPLSSVYGYGDYRNALRKLMVRKDNNFEPLLQMKMAKNFIIDLGQYVRPDGAI